MMTVILWFKRDLRLADNPALVQAAGLGPVLPVYIVEPEGWAQPDAAGRHWDFVAEALDDLAHDIARLGGQLVLRRGCAVAVLADLARAHRATALVSHQETGNLWSYARDRRVAAWARGAGLAWHQPPQQGVTRRLASRDGWARGRDGFVSAPVLAVPRVIWAQDADPGTLRAVAPAMPADPCPGRQPGGRVRGLQTLASFLDHRGQGYRGAISSPLTARDACSRLSPHLAWGTLSVREVDQARAAHPAPGRWAGSLAAFGSRLAWRDHFTQKLEDEPQIEARCLDPLAEGLRPRDGDAARLRAWENGETGMPFVDACIRSLRATGWINFRMRAMLMAVASYHLWLDWRQSGPVLARAFTDYDPGIHWPQVQMQSGTTAINTIRIYNPVKQGRDQDPDGRFTRAWLSELAAVPDAHLQAPWEWAGAGTLRYPAPLVDPVAAQRAARDAVWALRRAPGAAQVAAAVAQRHASRKDARGRFIRDPAPQRPRQLSFDL